MGAVACGVGVIDFVVDGAAEVAGVGAAWRPNMDSGDAITNAASVNTPAVTINTAATMAFDLR